MRRAESQQLVPARSREGFPRRALTLVPVSATLAANEVLARRREAGAAVLPLAFGEAGLPVHPLLRNTLPAAAGTTPTARWQACLNCDAAAGYWARRGLPTTAEAVVCGPGSKPLLFALLLAMAPQGTPAGAESSSPLAAGVSPPAS